MVSRAIAGRREPRGRPLANPLSSSAIVRRLRVSLAQGSGEAARVRLPGIGPVRPAQAERRFREVVDRYPRSEAAVEALYRAGESRYKATGDAAALADTSRQFKARYADTSWAKKASVWAG
jgi:hypothetical protein